MLFKGLTLAALLIALPAFGDSPEEPTAEYKIKAALIYKLTKFVEWPHIAFKEPESPLEICLLGDNPFSTALHALGERSAGGRSISVKHYPEAGVAVKNGCHLIVVADGPRGVLADILDSVANRPVLTVSDISRFAEQGGIIELASNNNRIGFRINLKSAKLAGLKIAAPLLRLSDVVKAPVDQGE